MGRRISWELFCKRHFFGWQLPCGSNFSPWMIMSAAEVHSGSMPVWQDADSGERKKKKKRAEREKTESRQKECQITTAEDCSRPHTLWQEGECGGKRRRNERLERGVLGGKERNSFAKTSGFDYEGKHGQASLCCLFWLGFSEEVDVIYFWFASGFLTDE